MLFFLAKSHSTYLHTKHLLNFSNIIFIELVKQVYSKWNYLIEFGYSNKGIYVHWVPWVLLLFIFPSHQTQIKKTILEVHFSIPRHIIMYLLSDINKM